MQLDGLLVYSVLGEEIGDLESLIALQLDDLTHLLILDKSTVARKFLRKKSQQTPMLRHHRATAMAMYLLEGLE